jgi:DnaJ domain
MSGEQPADNYYSLLKVARTASLNEVKDALRLQRRHYNNRANSAPKAEDRLEAQRMIKLLEEAGRTLTDPSARELYDARLGGSKPRLEIRPIAPPVQDGPRPPGLSTQRPFKVRGFALLKWGKKHPRIAGLAIVGLLWIMGSSGRGFVGSQSGSVSASWPVGATTAGVLAPVLHSLQSCAEAATPQPANCPQSDINVGQASGVTWTLYGDPGSGAEISYSNSLFAVLGHAVMTLQYSTGLQPPQLRKVEPVGYDAAVRWNGGHPTLVSLLPLQQEPTPAITQPRPNATDAAIKQAFHAQFSQCISTTNPSLQMPPICPQLQGVYGGSGTKNVHWRSDADPLLNSTVTYDSASGIFHLIGSFALTVTYEDDAGNPQEQHVSGNYDAVLAVNGKTPVVLVIDQT